MKVRRDKKKRKNTKKKTVRGEVDSAEDAILVDSQTHKRLPENRPGKV